MTTPPNSCIVTLVHGTWGGNSPFAAADGPVATHLKSALLPARIESFRWSGRNRVSARLRAAQQLAEHIRFNAAKSPQAKQFLVCHSHGGNVALHALKDADIDSLIEGVVCFSTPFICVSRRTDRNMNLFSKALKILLGFPLSILAVAVIVFLAQFEFVQSMAQGLDHLAEGMEVSPLMILLLAAATLIAIASLLVGPSLLVSPIVERWIQLAVRHEDRLKLPDLGKERLLIVRTTADEASAAIAIPSFIGWLTSSLYGLVMGLTMRAARFLSRPFENISSPLATILVSPLLFIAAILMLAGSLLISIPAALLAALTAASGIAYASTAVFLHASVESSPPGAYTVHNYNVSSQSDGLAHSASYFHPAALFETWRWILERNLSPNKEAG